MDGVALPGGVPTPFSETGWIGGGGGLLDGEALGSLFTSLVENMRVNRSLTDAFSAGLGGWSAAWPLSCGEPLGLLTSADLNDLTDAGWEVLDTVVDLDSEVLAMLCSDDEDVIGGLGWGSDV